ncbi:gas vesicle protein GvpG [Amycolatopsis cynarae]|uniref:Gas vesicle protein G n=2 Tax=Amycolatopsis TaxID=1813 RepID=A0A558A9L0_9PSEU|nr:MULTISPECIES: gas vesicle protein GvpG [Amycolatopsis]TVT20947.1 gas vesicle protein G [Amycolatopsis rhizosphaerae]WAL68915.1 gas vesicle protein GvpG [Amycolatopsis sp. HUAS 11-8]
MGLITGILGLPFAPVRAVIALAEVIERRVQEELHDPATARRELEEAERARAAGEITAEEEAEIQQAVLDRMARAPGAKER